MTINFEKYKAFGAAVAMGICLVSCTTVQANQDETQAILTLNTTLSQHMIVDRDGTLFEALAVPNFRVLAPGGVVENKEQVLRGLPLWDVKSIEITNEAVAFHGNIAVVTNRLDIDGTMKPIGRWGPLKSMRTFVKEGDDWRLVAQSLTPCLPKAVEVGRC